MDRRTVHRRGSYKNKKKSGGFGVIAWILVFALLIGGGVFAYKNRAWFLPDEPEKPAKKEDKVKTPLADSTDAILADMTLEEKAYQMLFVTPESITGVGIAVAAGDATRAAIEAYPVGGIVYFSDNFQNPDQTTTMLSNTKSYSKIPLFIGVDEEGGDVSRLAYKADMGLEAIPPMREIGDAGDTDAAYQIGETLAARLNTFGFNVNFAPVADVLINSDNTEIGNRSFGTDATVVSNMVSEVVGGLQDNGISAVLKHFPGHGSALTDSHTGYSESLRTYDQLKETEFLPFQAGIDAGANFVMISHMTLVNAVEENVPSSLSKKVITDWLKDELGFTGIVITDSFAMGAITENYDTAEAVTLAIDAGADMILIPTDVKAAADAIVAAVNNGTISEDRIDESVRKILKCKENMGLF